VYVGLVRTLLIDQSTFENCSGSTGGALHLSQGYFQADEVPSFTQQPLAITNSRFVNNRATGNGGSVAIQDVTADVQFTGCTFLNSTSTEGWGGSVFVEGAETRRIRVDFNDCVFNHSVAVRGGAVFASLLQLIVQATSFSHTYGEIDWRAAVALHCDRGRSRCDEAIFLSLLKGSFNLFC